MTERIKDMLDAINSDFDGSSKIYDILCDWSTKDIHETLQKIVRKNGKQAKSDLKDFTKAAMQGLLSQDDIKRVCQVGEALKTDYVGAIAKMSIEIAEATLSELQKQQP